MDMEITADDFLDPQQKVWIHIEYDPEGNRIGMKIMLLENSDWVEKGELRSDFDSMDILTKSTMLNGKIRGFIDGILRERDTPEETGAGEGQVEDKDKDEDKTFVTNMFG